MADALGVAPDALVSVHQVHSPDAVVVEGPWPGDRPKADAMVTRRPGLALGITTADCGPVLFADGGNGVVGGRPCGLAGRVDGRAGGHRGGHGELGATGASRRRARPDDQPPPMRSAPNSWPASVAGPGQRALLPPASAPGHALFDLPAFIGARLGSGRRRRLRRSRLCTYSDEERFYSYRRNTHRGEPDYGRLISAIAITA